MKDRKLSKDEQLADDFYELVSAFAPGEEEEVRSLLRKGADPNHKLYWDSEWTSGWKRPPLHNACYNEDLTLIKILVHEGGADLNKGDEHGRTPLHWALKGRSKEIAIYLIDELMCDVDKLDNEEKSPLDIILDPGNLYEGTDYITDVAIHILNRGGGTDEQKVKLLLGACFRGKMDLTKELVEHYNIDPKSVRDDKGQSSLSKACSRVFIHSECPDIALYLINLGCECSQEEKAKLLIGTSGWGRVEVLKELIEKHNFQFDVRDKSGQTPLTRALGKYALYEMEGCLHSAYYLVSCGCGDERERAKLLCGACWWGKLDMAKELIEKYKIDPSVTVAIDDETVSTPFLAACYGGTKALVVYLVEGLKCDTDVKTKPEEQSGLHLACAAGHKEVVAYLVEKLRFDLEAESLSGRTPLQEATHSGHTAIAQYLNSMPASRPDIESHPPGGRLQCLRTIRKRLNWPHFLLFHHTLFVLVLVMLPISRRYVY